MLQPFNLSPVYAPAAVVGCVRLNNISANFSIMYVYVYVFLSEYLYILFLLSYSSIYTIVCLCIQVH